MYKYIYIRVCMDKLIYLYEGENCNRTVKTATIHGIVIVKIEEKKKYFHGVFKSVLDAKNKKNESLKVN